MLTGVCLWMYKNISGKVYIKTFDGFDLYQDGKMVYFSSAKAKELLAFLVDRKGRFVPLSQLAENLFENEKDIRKAKRLVHTAFNRLTKTLKSYEIEDILKRGRGVYAVDCSRILCDSYEMEARTEGSSNFFLGEYMPEYSWAEVTLSNLLRKYYDENQLPDHEGDS